MSPHCSPRRAAPPLCERPNLAVFAPGQLRADVIGAFSNPNARTSHIDALAERGTRFTTAYVPTESGGRSRPAFLGGCLFNGRQAGRAAAAADT
jgi:arylsulfatase A-like enzyme